MRWHLHRPISWRAGVSIFGGIGLIMIGLAIASAQRLQRELATRPSLEANVDSARVASAVRGRYPMAMYAARLWVTYHAAGITRLGSVTETVFSSDYGGAVRTVDAIRRAAKVTVLANPRDPADLILSSDKTWRYFFSPLSRGSLGLFFCGLASLLWAFGRRVGFDRTAAKAFWPGSAHIGAVAGGVTGVLLLSGAVFWVYSERTIVWKSVDARVDSADVVWDINSLASIRPAGSRPGGRYALRRWLTYTQGGEVYHTPVVESASSADPDAIAARAITAAAGRVIPALVNAGNPYHISLPLEGHPASVWGPALFGLLGVGSLAVVALLLRAARRPIPRHQESSGLEGLAAQRTLTIHIPTWLSQVKRRDWAAARTGTIVVATVLLLAYGTLGVMATIALRNPANYALASIVAIAGAAFLVGNVLIYLRASALAHTAKPTPPSVRSFPESASASGDQPPPSNGEGI